MKRYLGLAALLLITPALPSVAWAQDEAKAAALAREAEDLLAADKVAEACTKLDESVRIDARSATALELGRCREKQGRAGSAYRAYVLAEKLARKEKRTDRARTAIGKKQRLVFKIAKLTISVSDEAKGVDGLIVTVGGEVVPADAYGKAWEVGTSELTLEASAPGYETFSTTVKLAARQKKTVEVPALKKGASAPPKPAEPKSDGAPEPASEGEEEEPTDDGQPDEEGGPPAEEHEDWRLVVEVGAMGGFLYSDLSTGGVTSLVGVNYQYFIDPLTQRNVACGNTTVVPGAGECEAVLGSEIGGTVGGMMMVGWAFSPRFHAGVRGMFQVRFPEGFIAGAGPSISGRVTGPLWLGASFMVGGEHHRADVEQVTGSIPEDARQFNDDQETLQVPLEDVGLNRDDVESGLLLGGMLELSVAILGPSPHALVPLGEPSGFFSGSLYAGIYPTIMAFSPGFVLSVPAGISYRFH